MPESESMDQSYLGWFLWVFWVTWSNNGGRSNYISFSLVCIFNGSLQGPSLSHISHLLLPFSSLITPRVARLGSALSPEHGSKRHLVKSDPTPFGFKGTSTPHDRGGPFNTRCRHSFSHPFATEVYSSLVCYHCVYKICSRVIIAIITKLYVL